MIERDIHSSGATVETALYNLNLAIKEGKRDKNRIVCLVVGYGSSGGTHKIRSAVIDKLEEYLATGRIKAYISGGDLTYGPKHLEFLKKAPGFPGLEFQANAGVIYVSV